MFNSGSGSPLWLAFSFNSHVRVSRYLLSTGQDPNLCPHEWTLFGGIGNSPAAATTVVDVREEQGCSNSAAYSIASLRSAADDIGTLRHASVAISVLAQLVPHGIMVPSPLPVTLNKYSAVGNACRDRLGAEGGGESHDPDGAIWAAGNVSRS